MIKEKLPVIAPSLLSADFSQLKNEIKAIEKTQAKWLHLDIMDGAFVPNLTFGPAIVEKIRRHTKLYFDAHLMVENPEQYLTPFKNAGVDHITVHVETTNHLHKLLENIRQFGMTAGISLNPLTPLSAISEALPYVDLVLIMSVNPGFSGQKFIASSVQKIQRLSQIRADQNLTFAIEVDGGVSDKNIGELYQAGAEIFVAGSFIFDGSQQYAPKVSRLLKACR